MDILFEDASILSPCFFHELDAILTATKVTETGHVPSHGNVISSSYVIHQGPIKRPRRSLEKIWRKFHGDPRSLTDIVRCSVLVDSVASAHTCLAAIISHSHPTLSSATHPRINPLSENSSSEDGSTHRLFWVTKVRDEFSSNSRSEISGAAETGRRSISLNVEVAWDGAAGSRLLCTPEMI